jgi:O-antigen/teichoic acid export membrane protein
MISMGLNFLVQIITVRYLVKSDYGAFAYALSMVSMASSISLIGLDKAMARFVPIYQEKKNYPKMFGTMVMAIGSVIGVGLSLLLLVLGTRGILGERLVNDPLALSLLLVVIALAPLQALDSLFENLLAVFMGAKAIFFRRHLLGPGLRLVAVLAVIGLQGDAYMLAIGYLLSGILGTSTFVLMLYQGLKQKELLPHFSWKRLSLPFREVFSFSVPLLTTDAAFILRSNMVIFLLESLRGTIAVAEFRAVLPVADVNLLVFQSFRYLYTPLASRLYAQKDDVSLNDLYWKTAVWIAVFSFPILAVTFALSEPVVQLLFGERYLQSAPILAVLALGSYFNASLGFNYHTLSVYKRVRYLVFTDVTSAVFGLGLTLMFIPRYGPLGAALGVSASLVTNNLLNHIGLWRQTAIDLFRWSCLQVYVTIILGIGFLWFMQRMFAPSFIVGFFLAALVSLFVLWINREVMEVGTTFPELKRAPLVGKFLVK